jgi:hypothetical protein
LETIHKARSRGKKSARAARRLRRRGMACFAGMARACGSRTGARRAADEPEMSESGRTWSRNRPQLRIPRAAGHPGAAGPSWRSRPFPRRRPPTKADGGPTGFGRRSRCW